MCCFFHPGMNIQSELLKEHSKAQTLKIARYIGSDEDRFGELMAMFWGSEYRLSQRAAWVLRYCAESHPSLIMPYLRSLIDNLERPVPDAVKRNTVRVLQETAIPEELQGKLADICFTFLASAEPVAVKVFAMTVLANLAKKEPDLKNELMILIQDQLPYASAGFVSRGRKVLLELEK